MAYELWLCAVAAATAAWLALQGEVVPMDGTRDLWAQRALRLCASIGVSPLGRRLEGWRSWRVVGHEIQRRVRQRSVLLDRSEASGLMVLAILGVCLGLCWLAGTWMVIVFMPVGVVLGITAWANALEQAHLERAARAMPDVFRSLASSLATGHSLAQAIAHVATHAPAEVGEAFSRASWALSLGMPLGEAMAVLERSLVAPGAQFLSLALVVSARTGAPLDALLRRSADMVEAQAALKSSLRVRTAQVRLSSRVVMALPMLLVGLLAMVVPDYRSGLLTPVGLGCLLIAIALDAIAMLIMRKLMAQVAL